MCGRVVVTNTAWSDYCTILGIAGDEVPDSYNATPAQELPIIVVRSGRPRAAHMRWGLVPSWSEEMSPTYTNVNAAVETLDSNLSWRCPWKLGQRCILPVAGFYEWRSNRDGSKTPYYIHLTDRTFFGLAAIWDRSPAAGRPAIESFALITVPENGFLNDIKNRPGRMPAILAMNDHEVWLRGTPDSARAALKQYPGSFMDAWPVSARVNLPENNDPALIQPVHRLTSPGQPMHH